MNLLSDTLEEKMTLQSNPESLGAFEELENSVYAALETYSNVHRGSGHYSLIATALFERARDIVTEHMGLEKGAYRVVFCTAYGAEKLKKQFQPGDFEIISSRDVGLSLGVRAMAIKKNAFPKGTPFQTGGNVARMVSADSVIWAEAPHRFEPGTPAIINAIALAKALLLRKKFGDGCFMPSDDASCVSEMLYKDEFSAYSGLLLLMELRKRIIGSDLLVPTAGGEKTYVNFDNAASTPAFSPVWKVAQKAWRITADRHAEIITEVRKILSGFLHAGTDKYETLFTSNTTEAINIAATFVAHEFGNSSDTVILNTLLEHNSNELPWRYLPGATLVRLPINKEGFINLDELEAVLRKYNREDGFGSKRIRIVAVSGASNVLGTFNDIETITRIAHTYGARVLVDGAQLFAHRAVDLEKWGVDYFAFSGHKAYAPFGSGALLVRKEFVHGHPAELESIRKSGTENVVGIAALGKAVLLLQRIGMNVIEETEQVLLRRLLKGLAGIQGVTVYGIKDAGSDELKQKGGIVSFLFKKVPHNRVATMLAELDGIGTRYGCFCAHMLIKHLLGIPRALESFANAVLTILFRFSDLTNPGLIRVSLGIENEESEVDRMISTMERIANPGHAAIIRSLSSTQDGKTLTRSEVKTLISKFLKKRVSMVLESA